jgi:hypothetical protein
MARTRRDDTIDVQRDARTLRFGFTSFQKVNTKFKGFSEKPIFLFEFRRTFQNLFVDVRIVALV